MTTQQVEPFLVHCATCQWEHSLGWLPMPTDSAALLLKHTRCPNGHARKSLRMGPVPKPTATGNAEAWLTNGDTGTSSKTIWTVMMGRFAGSIDRFDVPHDPADFGRCYRLLQVMPAWRARLPEVAAKYPEWAPLVAAWDELTALYEEELPKRSCPKLYQRMQALRGRAE